MYTLCIIDLQEYFGVAPNTRVTNNSEREIRQAISDGASILLVEYEGCGETIKQLTEAAKHAPRTFSIDKESDDGSKEIVSAIHRHNLVERHIKVCGVNTDCCVYRTVVGLQARLPNTKIEVVADACDSDWSPDSHIRGIKSCRDLGVSISNYKPEDYINITRTADGWTLH